LKLFDRADGVVVVDATTSGAVPADFAKRTEGTVVRRVRSGRGIVSAETESRWRPAVHRASGHCNASAWTS